MALKFQRKITISHSFPDAKAYGWDLPASPQLQWSRFIENKVLTRARAPSCPNDTLLGKKLCSSLGQLDVIMCDSQGSCVPGSVSCKRIYLAPFFTISNDLAVHCCVRRFSVCLCFVPSRTTRSCASMASTRVSSLVPALKSSRFHLLHLCVISVSSDCSLPSLVATAISQLDLRRSTIS